MTLRVALHGPVSNDFVVDVAFSLASTGVTALLGPSGSGKTCVLRAIAGLDRVRGTVNFENMVWQNDRIFVPPHLRRIGYVFQGVGLLPHLTVAESLDYAAKRAPRRPAFRAALVEQFGLATLLDRRPARLSGGEAQRANIVRALLSQPRLLLMDEPLSALDVAARTGLLGEIKAHIAAAHIPMVYVTHDVAEAVVLDAQPLWLNQGCLGP
jgi:molybdate transport system ATP-binding protein